MTELSLEEIDLRSLVHAHAGIIHSEDHRRSDATAPSAARVS